MLASFLLMFASLYLAQIGDKTQLLTILLSTRTKKHFLLFLAIMTGFTVGVTLAVILGSGLALLIPHKVLKVISGVIFIILGALIFLDGRKGVSKKKHYPHKFFSIAGIIFLADFGDKTQIAIALFASSYSPYIVFLAAIAALGLDTLLLVLFSKVIMKRLKESIIEKIAGAIFIGVGAFLFL
ncbi:MAG: TMEM165/GDT1 family protein [Candidatus Levyibacteriota bacterium]